MINIKKEELQDNMLTNIIENDYIGTIVSEMGSGKSKAAIDAIKKGGFNNILITSPRTNLKDNWQNELNKWYFTSLDFAHDNSNFTLENIQTCYKWEQDKIRQFDLIVADEIHLIVTPEYGRLLRVAAENDIKRIGLTGTADLKEPEKVEFYDKYCPIIFQYENAANDGLINQRKYIICEYNLTDNYKVLAGSKKNPFWIGEKSQYDYLTEQLKKGQILMTKTGSEDWFEDAANWFWKGKGDKEQKNAGRIYLQAIKHRKDFLWNLTSSAEIAKSFKNKILSNPDNKVLLFSERNKQAEKLSEYTVHSNNSEEHNKQTLFAFDNGKIRELSSCNSLTLGLNIEGANWAIMESYNSSDVLFKQKSGRTNRLNINDIANIMFIVPLETQAEKWFNKATKGLLDPSNTIRLESINNLKV